MAEEKSLQGGKQIARVFKEENVEYMFGISGGHVFAFMVGAGSYGGVKLVHCRHEQAGGYAADAYARASGRPGVCFGTAGPGMTNQVSAIAQAYFCKSPVVAFYGQHLTAEDGRGALQECFAEPVLQSLTKWTRRIVNPSVLAYWTKRAFRDAMTYPQGPVAIEVPADIMAQRTLPSAQVGFIDNSYPEPQPPQANPETIEKAVRLLLEAERPVIAGGEAIFWSNASEELREFVELTNIPVITRRVARGAVPEDHPLAFRGRARGKILRAADVACTIGLNLGYLEGYGAWAKNAKLIQITESKSDIEFTAKSEMIILGNPKEALKQMIDCARDLIKGSSKKEAWLKQVDEIKAAEDKRLADMAEEVKNNKPIHLSWMAHEAVSVLDRDATVIFDGFSSSAYITERFVAKHAGAVLDAGNWAGVGHGVGMGIGAQLARPGKQVLVMMGDGGMGLGGFDVETACRVQAPVVYLLANNSAWMAAIGPQYRHALPIPGYQDEWTSWGMLPTNYAKVFEPMGAHTERVEDPADLKPALERAYASGKTSVIDCLVDRTIFHPIQARRGLEVKPEAGPMANFWDPEDVSDEFRPKMFPKLYEKEE